MSTLREYSRPPVPVTSPLLSTDATSLYLQVHPRTLVSWRVEGGGPPYARVGRRVFYRQTDLDQWLDDHVFTDTGHEQSTSAMSAAGAIDSRGGRG